MDGGEVVNSFLNSYSFTFLRDASKMPPRWFRDDFTQFCHIFSLLPLWGGWERLLYKLL